MMAPPLPYPGLMKGWNEETCRAQRKEQNDRILAPKESYMRRLISSGSVFEQNVGYSRAVVEGDWVFVSGTTGFDYSTMTIAADVVEQVEQCFKNIIAALAEAGCDLSHVVRVHYILPDRGDFEPCWPVLRRYFGEIRPASTMIVAGLADPRMRIEIEVTAHR
jgi:enamine deaminase RidA (YjgF/YER057c/UK114 family)